LPILVEHVLHLLVVDSLGFIPRKLVQEANEAPFNEFLGFI
jgi:hypothetical protein